MESMDRNNGKRPRSLVQIDEVTAACGGEANALKILNELEELHKMFLNDTTFTNIIYGTSGNDSSVTNN